MSKFKPISFADKVGHKGQILAADGTYIEPSALQKGEPPVRVVVCMVSHDTVPMAFAYDLAHMMGVTSASLVADGVIDIAMRLVSATYIETGRRDVIRDIMRDTMEGRAEVPTHLLWLDTDMRFPSDLLIRLLAHNKDIVGCNYPTRRLPVRPVSFEKIDYYRDMTGDAVKEESERSMWTKKGIHKILWTYPDSTGLAAADVLGFGAVLIRWSVFEHLGPTCFRTQWEENGDFSGEDVMFFKRARAEGFEVWCDQDLSKKIGHIGGHTFTWEHAWSFIAEHLTPEQTELWRNGVAKNLKVKDEEVP